VKTKNKWRAGVGEVSIEISEYSVLDAHWRHIISFFTSLSRKRRQAELLVSAVLIMSTVTSKKNKALDEDAPSEECDRTPAIPTNIISDLILPFVQDRGTWNSVCSATKELYEASMGMTPPWPETKFNLGQSVRSLKFSPSGSFLACGSRTAPYRVSICDRRGRITRLTGHTSCVSHLSFSKDGKYLASAGDEDRSIRIWPTNSTGLPEQSGKSLRGHLCAIACFDFAPDDSNILVSVSSSGSGDVTGADIKVWNVETEVCTRHINHGSRYIRIRSMFFPAGDKDYKCIFVTSAGLLIRTCWDGLSDTIASDIVNMPGLDGVLNSAFSPCGSLLAASSHDVEDDVTGYVTLYDMKAMRVVQRVALDSAPGSSNGLAFSPNGKTMVCDCGHAEILVLQVKNLQIQRRLRNDSTVHNLGSAIAFDPGGQFVASAGCDNYVRLWTL
jgi:WD40 repeat protein